eukprot:1052270-Pleurochrysis_carterae.AAC.5
MELDVKSTCKQMSLRPLTVVCLAKTTAARNKVRICIALTNVRTKDCDDRIEEWRSCSSCTIHNGMVHTVLIVATSSMTLTNADMQVSRRTEYYSC